MNITNQIKKSLALTIISFGLVFSSFAQGPNAPEAASFEPVDAVDMVNLATGDLAYVLPLLNVPSPEGGYPLALSYHAGISTDQEASWVGLGWSLNPGAINRNVNGFPDDWESGVVKEFTYDIGGEEETNSISIGFGVPNAYSVGVGVSWGSNKTFSGSVSVSLANASASVGTDGASLGINGIANLNVGYNGSVGISSSFGFGGANLGIGIGYDINSDKVNSSLSLGSAGYSMGVSLSSGGASLYTNGFNISNISSHTNSSDVTVDHSSSSFMLLTPWGYFSFGKNKTKWELNVLNNFGSQGSLYSQYDPKQLSNDRFFSSTNSNASFDLVDVSTEGALEQSTVSQYIENNNASLQNYDNYNVSSQGLSGGFRPILTDNRYNDIGRDRIRFGNDQLDIYSAEDGNDIIHPIYFNFNNVNQTYLNILPYQVNYADNDNTSYTVNNNVPTLPNGFIYDSDGRIIHHQASYSEINHRKREGDYIEYFTIEDINNGNAEASGFLDVPNGGQRGLIDCGIPMNISGNIDFEEFWANETHNSFEKSIGGFKITTTDGKSYHYSKPVYQMEQVRRLYGISDSHKTETEAHVDRMRVTPYATHWLLTAITGPDYVKADINRKFPDQGDYGYWVRFDYGLWSNGYIWKTPNGKYSESVDVFEEVKEYSWGRKQIYYLDQIKTRTHTAIFSKDIRYDNKSENMRYQNLWHLKSGNTNFMDVTSQPLLKLDKIYLLKNEDTANISKINTVPLINSRTYNHYLTGRFVYDAWETQPYSFWYREFEVNNNNNVFDKNDFINSNIENNAVKIIKFNNDYSLAVSAPNSDYGKLTLKNVQFFGKGGETYLPPYKFDYGYNLNYDIDAKGDFGYNKSQPQAWSLNNITTPLGGEIDINYEADDYGKVAINQGRVFTSQLKFTFLTTPPLVQDSTFDSAPEGSTQIKIEIDNQDSTTAGINLADYFDPTQPFFMDMWYSATYNHSGAGYDRSTIDINKKMATILQLDANQNFMIIQVDASSPFFRDAFQSSAEPVSVLHAGGDYAGVENQDKPRYEAAWTPDQGERKYSMRHTIIGNKVAQRDAPGIRVANITVKDDNNQYTTNYNYNKPNSSESSGVISYYPEKNHSIYQQAPYISLLPSPVVSYEYVTQSDDEIKTQYKFKVLDTILEDNINNTVSFGDVLEIQCITETPSNPDPNITADIKYASITDNTKSLGRLEETTSFNLSNQMISQTNYNFNLPSDDNIEYGIYKEAYYSSRRITHSSYINDVYEFNTYHFYTSVTKANIKNTLLNIENIKNGYKNTTHFEQHDFLTGQALETITEDSKGNRFKTEIIPAYTIPEYSTDSYSMGSKVDNSTNKNMLTQEAMSKSYMEVAGNWELTGVGINTWNNKWNYINLDGNLTQDTNTPVTQKIWRKHKNFVWDGELNTDGTYQNFVGEDDDFNWGVAAATSETVQTNPNWKNVSTTTLYDHYSVPQEVRDLNNNYASTKMDKIHKKVISTVNAAYSEQFYSGAEDAANGWTGGQVHIANHVDTFAHTGVYSEQATTGSQNFKVEVKPILHATQNGSENYHISVWVHKNNGGATDLSGNARVFNGNSLEPFNGETIYAGDWIQLNHYLHLSNTSQVYVTSSSGTLYFDDFRIHPTASNMSSYVYNEWDELECILGANNLATRYEYDAQGRLTKTYSEVVDFAGEGTGGFKQTSETDYYYQNN